MTVRPGAWVARRAPQLCESQWMSWVATTVARSLSMGVKLALEADTRISAILLVGQEDKIRLPCRLRTLPTPRRSRPCLAKC